MPPTADIVSDEVTQLRAEGSESSLDQAAEIERGLEEHLAKTVSDDDQLRAQGYDPDALRKEYGGRSSMSVPSSSKAKLSGDLTRAQLEKRAAAAGVENPKSFSNKAELIDAINEKEG